MSGRRAEPGRSARAVTGRVPTDVDQHADEHVTRVEGVSYGQYCPISRALDLLGDRWSLLIVRDMIVGATRFNDLARGLPRMSRTLLSKRLRQLQHAGLVERAGSGYHLTAAGRALEPVVFGLGEWGAQWAFGDPDPHELDAELLVWWMHERLDTSGWPGDRHVVHVRFTDDQRQWWIVVEAGEASVCTSDPGYPIDMSMTSDVSSLYQVWLGRLPLAAALRSGGVRLDGPSSLVRTMGDVLGLSPVAALVSAATRAG